MNQKIVKINGTDYTLQKISAREWIRMRKRCTKNNNFDDEKFIEEILEHIIIDPKRKIDDFDDYAELEEVVAEAVNFQSGRQVL